jgi:hypothetical protein
VILSSTLVGFWWQLGVQIGSKMHQVGDIWRAFSRICCQWCSPWLPDLPATSPTPLKINLFKNFLEKVRFFNQFSTIWEAFVERLSSEFSYSFCFADLLYTTRQKTPLPVLSCTSTIQHDTRKRNGDIFKSFPKPSQESTALEFGHIL